MTCSEFIDGFSEYYDGVAPAEVAAEAEAHAASCETCRRYHDVFDRGRTLLRSFPEIEVTDDFHPRLRHRLFHVDDEDALAPGTAGSATTAGTALGMALLLVMAAWAPVMWTEPEVDLAPIVVSRPEARPVRLQVVPVSVLPRGGPSALEAATADIWQHSNSLLFQHSRLNGRRSAALARTGLD